MNAAIVARTLSLIPDRVPRVQSGSAFDPAVPSRCAHPERIVHLAQFLGWLGPLHPITKDDLHVFGLMTPYGKPAMLAVADEDEAEAGPKLQPEVKPEVEPEDALT